MKPYSLDSGYLCIKLTMEKKRYHFLIHRLVAEYFIPNPENKPEVNHKDGNKNNNNVWNLEWVTKKENMIHAAENDLLHPKIGSDSPFAKHEESQIHKACQLMEEGKFSLSEISILTGVSYKTIMGIRNRDKWKHISQQYEIPKGEPRWDKETEAAIQVLRDQGFTYKEILNRIGKPETDANILRASRLINRVKSSTTIPWVVFDFNSGNLEE